MITEQTIIYIDERVFHHQVPITRIVHDRESKTLLLFGEHRQVEQWITTPFVDACRIEPSIREVLDLPLGWQSQRVGNAWRRAPLYARAHGQQRGLLVVAALSAAATLFIAWQDGFPSHMLVVVLVGVSTGVLTLALLYVLFRRR